MRLANLLGTPVAKVDCMLTLFAFFIAVAGVFSSVFWACKHETTSAS